MESMDSRQQHIYAVLNASPAMFHLSEDQILEIIPLIREVYIAKGAELMHEGDLADDFYIIEHGEVEVIKEFPDGEKQVLAVLTAGECVGELSVLENNPHAVRAASIRALNSVKLLALSVEALHSPWIDKHTYQQVILNLAQIVSKRLCQSNNRRT